MPVRLHVNIDHVATVRNARGTRYPDPILAAALCEAAGADGVTAHLREDRRHIRDEDVERLRHELATLLNLEMAATAEMRAIAERVVPDVITLVPERREERTTEGGLDIAGQREAIERVVAMARVKRIRVSLFIAPDEAMVALARDVGADQIELHTGEYSHAVGAARREQLARLVRATAAGRALGLEIAAGHGLTRHNVGDVVAIDGVDEVNIGHALVADAVLFGLDRAVRDMRAAIERGARRRMEGPGAP
jgi:pyridoxine 5-phosphate synthase